MRRPGQHCYCRPCHGCHGKEGAAPGPVWVGPKCKRPHACLCRRVSDKFCLRVAVALPSCIITDGCHGIVSAASGLWAISMRTCMDHVKLPDARPWVDRCVNFSKTRLKKRVAAKAKREVVKKLHLKDKSSSGSSASSDRTSLTSSGHTVGSCSASS